MKISFSSIIYNNYIRSINFFLILSKKGCQGCHISKLGPRNFEICTWNWRIFNSWSFGTNRFHGSCFDFVLSCAVFVSICISPPTCRSRGICTWTWVCRGRSWWTCSRRRAASRPCPDPSCCQARRPTGWCSRPLCVAGARFNRKALCSNDKFG